jgi:hypothetical protein
MDDADRLHSPPAELLRFVHRIADETLRNHVEERQFPRFKLTVEVWVQPVDANFEPLGEPFTAVSRDISTGGIGLMHTRAIRDKYLWLRLVTHGGGTMNVVVEVLRCRPIGVFYDIGAKFVAKLDEAPGFEVSKP